MNLRPMNFQLAVPAFLAAVAVLAAPAVAMACPFCKEALGSNGDNIVAGYFYSILFMLSMPFLIFGGIAGYFYRLVRRARAEQQIATASARANGRAQLQEPVGV